jgi:GGDEF domain-containing protein
MRNQPPKDVVEQLMLIHSHEKDSLGIKIDDTLIKQFARRIYESMKEQMLTDREEAEELLNAIFGDVRKEVESLSSHKD